MYCNFYLICSNKTMLACKKLLINMKTVWYDMNDKKETENKIALQGHSVQSDQHNHNLLIIESQCVDNTINVFVILFN